MVFKKSGFTIVELMIAITVFAVASTLVLAGVIYIGRQYQGGSNRVKLEDASRNVHQQITQSLQFSKKPDPIKPWPTHAGYNVFCVGEDKYIFNDFPIINGSLYNTAKEGLILAENDDDCGSNSTNAVNLLPEGAKVGFFEYRSSDSTLSTVFLMAPANGGDLIKDLSSTPPIDPWNIGCDIAKPGREFCSSVKFQSTSIGRLTN